MCQTDMALKSVKPEQVTTIPAKPGDVIYSQRDGRTYFVLPDNTRVNLNDLFAGTTPRVREPGPVGPAGPQGAPGKDGHSIVGAVGPAGAPGERGAVGPRGFMGERGADGAVGPQGAPGRDAYRYVNLATEHIARIDEIEFKLNALLEANQKGAHYVAWLKAQVEQNGIKR
jgi:hypothetical protein